MSRTKRFAVATTFTADDRLSAALKRISHGLDSTFGALTSKLRRDANAARKITTSLFRMGQVGFQAGKQIFSMVTDATGALDLMAKTSRRAGVSLDTFQELEFAASLSGVSMENFSAAIEHFARSLGKAKAGQGSLNSFLSRVSPNMRAAVIGAESVDAALDAVFEGLSRLEDPTKRQAFAGEAFGRGGADLALMAEGGVEGLRAMRREAHELGLVLGKDAFSNAEAFNDEADKLGRVWTGATRQVAATVAQVALPKLIELTDWIKGNRAEFDAAMQAIGKGIVDAAEGLVSLGKWLVENKDDLIDWAKILGGVYLATMVIPALTTTLGIMKAIGVAGKAAFAWSLAAPAAKGAIGAGAAGMGALGPAAAAKGLGSRALKAIPILGTALVAGELLVEAAQGPTMMETARQSVRQMHPEWFAPGATWAETLSRGDLATATRQAFDEARGAPSEARVKIEFANAPAGMTVRSAEATGVDLTVEQQRGRRSIGGDGL